MKQLLVRQCKEFQQKISRCELKIPSAEWFFWRTISKSFFRKTISKSFYWRTISKSFLQTDFEKWGERFLNNRFWKMLLEKHTRSKSPECLEIGGDKWGERDKWGRFFPCLCGVRRGFHADVAVHDSTPGLMWQTRDILGWFDKFGID